MLGPLLIRAQMMLCGNFCERYAAACGESLGLPRRYCATRARKPDPYYCYPLADRAAQVNAVKQGKPPVQVRRRSQCIAD
jgi:hypothetical protein